MPNERPHFVVRPLERADYHEWFILWTGYNAFYGRSGESAVSPDVTRATWARLFDAYEPVHGLVAAADRRLFGIVHYVYHRSTNHLDPACYLEDLFTGPAVRGIGVGRALIEGVAERAKSANAAYLYWHTQDSNATARRLYDALASHAGFIVYRRPL